VRTVKAVCHSTINLGRQGENLATEVEFDVSTWLGLFGEGTLEAVLKRSADETPYPVVITRNGAKAVWVVAELDTEVAGYGCLELRYLVGDAIVKSAIWATWVSESLGTEAVPPDPMPGWLDQTLQAINGVKKAIPPGGKAGEVLKKRTGADFDTEWGTGGGSGGYQIGHGLKLDAPSNTLSVDAVSDFAGDNTLPITAAAVQETVGNIEVLLGTI
jgi:hypothetical protein